MSPSLLLNVNIGELGGEDLLALARQVTVRPRKQLCVLLQPPKALIHATSKQAAYRVAKHAFTGGWPSITATALPIKFNLLVVAVDQNLSKLLPVLELGVFELFAFAAAIVGGLLLL